MLSQFIHMQPCAYGGRPRSTLPWRETTRKTLTSLCCLPPWLTSNPNLTKNPNLMSIIGVFCVFLICQVTPWVTFGCEVPGPPACIEDPHLLPGVPVLVADVRGLRLEHATQAPRLRGAKGEAEETEGTPWSRNSHRIV